MDTEIDKTIKINKNCITGNKVTSLDEIIQAADNKESIYHLWWGRKPARVFCMMQLQAIADAIKVGSLYRVINNKNNG